jgi:hypothetical protein
MHLSLVTKRHKTTLFAAKLTYTASFEAPDRKMVAFLPEFAAKCVHRGCPALPFSDETGKTEVY